MNTRRDFLRDVGFGIGALGLGSGLASAGKAAGGVRNILLITADDMNCDSVGVYGCDVDGTTPNIDRLASEGVRFTNAHVTIAVCQPCRGVLATGRYPHRSGIVGFDHIDSDIPTVMEIFQDAGFATGILGKVGHSTPKTSFEWDMAYDMADLGQGRDPDIYYKYAKRFFNKASKSGKRFYFMANSHDPHRPFYGSDQESQKFKDGTCAVPSRVYKPDEIEIPGFLPELPEVRTEIAEYYSSVRRSDDTVGAILKALEDSGQAENTLVMFLSDHGMALPFAKTNCYLHSTRTPWIVRWPGKVRPGRVDSRHFISGIDFLPTVLEATGEKKPAGMDGVSFLPILEGRRQGGRDKVFTQFHETSGRKRFPMRCIQNERFGYLFNPWSDGERVFKNESQSGRTFKAMQAGAETDKAIAERVDLFTHRVVEEFYDFEKDPDALHNLIDNPEYKDAIDRMRGEMAVWMKEVADPALVAFRNRDKPGALKQFMDRQDAESQAIRAAKMKANQEAKRNRK